LNIAFWLRNSSEAVGPAVGKGPDNRGRGDPLKKRILPDRSPLLFPTALNYPDPGCPQYGYDGDLANFAPRAGFAYRVTNDGKTSIGIPSPFPALYGSNIPGPDAQFVTPVILYYMQRDLQIPQLITWNLTFERQLGREWVVRAAYVGNKGTHISGSDDYNPAQEVNPAIYVPGSSTVGNTQDRRRFQDFSSVSEVGSNNNTKYHSAQLTVQNRFSTNFSILANYTWAKLLDDIGWTNPFFRSWPELQVLEHLGIAPDTLYRCTRAFAERLGAYGQHVLARWISLQSSERKR